MSRDFNFFFPCGMNKKYLVSDSPAWSFLQHVMSKDMTCLSVWCHCHISTKSQSRGSIIGETLKHKTLFLFLFYFYLFFSYHNNFPLYFTFRHTNVAKNEWLGFISNTENESAVQKRPEEIELPKIWM